MTGDLIPGLLSGPLRVLASESQKSDLKESFAVQAFTGVGEDKKIMHNSGCRRNKHTKKIIILCVIFRRSSIAQWQPPDRQKSFIMIWMTREIFASRRPAHTHFRARSWDKLTDYLYQILLGNYQPKRGAFVAWPESKIYDNRNAYSKNKKRATREGKQRIDSSLHF